MTDQQIEAELPKFLGRSGAEQHPRFDRRTESRGQAATGGWRATCDRPFAGLDRPAALFFYSRNRNS
jgi:hypothetical protein